MVHFPRGKRIRVGENELAVYAVMMTVQTRRPAPLFALAIAAIPFFYREELGTDLFTFPR